MESFSFLQKFEISFERQLKIFNQKKIQKHLENRGNKKKSCHKLFFLLNLGYLVISVVSFEYKTVLKQLLTLCIIYLIFLLQHWRKEKCHQQISSHVSVNVMLVKIGFSNSVIKIPDSALTLFKSSSKDASTSATV